MLKRFFKVLLLFILLAISASIYLHQEFYYSIWTENQITLGFLFFIIVLLAVGGLKLKNSFKNN